jgi:hypothetical protein
MIPPLSIWKKLYQGAWPGGKVQAVFLKYKQSGGIIQKPCALCGTLPAVAHHADYGKPFEVTFLCFRHHKLLHAQIAKRLDPIEGYTQQLHDEVLSELKHQPLPRRWTPPPNHMPKVKASTLRIHPGQPSENSRASKAPAK